MTYAPSQLLTFADFLAQYRDELADGELIDMEPTGPHEATAGKVMSKLNLAIEQMGAPWLIPTTCIHDGPICSKYNGSKFCGLRDLS